jgi:hypothetical protein
VAGVQRSRLARSLAASAFLLAPLIVAGCGEAESPAVCADVDALKASVAAVTDVDLDRNALATLQDRLTQVRSDLGEVKDSAADEYASEIDALDQAFASVGSSLDAAITSPSAQAVSDVGTAVRALGASLSALVDAVESTC